MPWWDEVAPQSRSQVRVESLSFDFDNPRFTPDKHPAADTDVAVVSYLAESADLAELLQSISASGYVDIEPLIVIGRGERLVVLEGNRRLAALKVLRDPNLAVDAKIVAPMVEPSKARTLEAVSVY